MVMMRISRQHLNRNKGEDSCKDLQHYSYVMSCQKSVTMSVEGRVFQFIRYSPGVAIEY